MDPTTLFYAVLLAVGLLGTDAVMYSGSVQVEVAAPPKIEDLSIDRASLATEFEDRLNAIASTNSVIRPPDIRPSEDKGLGMSLAEAANLQNVAYALQARLGYKPDRLQFALYSENGKLRALVSGASHDAERFRAVIDPNKDESLPDFVQRCALWGAAQLAPYATALYLLEKHASDEEFGDVITLADHVEAILPKEVPSIDRSLFENVRGLVALFKNDKQGARNYFDAAMKADPANPVPFLNAAFTDLQFDDYKTAAQRMSQLVKIAPPTNKVLLGTAYLTWGAAMMGQKDLAAADQLFAKAVATDPRSSTAYHLWSEEKEAAGDKEGAARLTRESLKQTASFENYAEVAALYFHLAWENNQPVTRSKFSNPDVVSFH